MSGFYDQLARLSPEQRALLSRRLAEAGLQQPSATARVLAKRTGTDPAPLSFAQQRLWFLQKLDAGQTAYNVTSLLRLDGALDTPALQRALDALLARHDILRTRYPAGAGSLPVQVVEPAQSGQVTFIDCSPQADPVAAVQIHRDEAAARPFDLAEVPVHIALIRESATRHHLLLATHHIVCDRWSVGVFLRELGQLYAAARRQPDAVSSEALAQAAGFSPLPIQYGDWAAWQQTHLQGETLDRLSRHWQDRLGGELPLLDLPLDHARPPVATDLGAIHPVQLDADLSQRLRTLAQQEQVTLFAVLLSLFKVLLHRYSGGADIVVGSEVANRDHTDTEGLIGLLVNTLVLRTDLSGNPRWRTALQRVRTTVLDALAHQELPFEKLVELLNPERHLDQMMPLFQAKFDLQPATADQLRLDGLTLSREVVDAGRTKYELRLNLIDAPEGIRGQIEYRSDLFEPETMARLARHFDVLARAVVAGPDVRIGQLPLMTADERQQMLARGETPAIAPTRPQDGDTLPARIAAQARRTPLALAVNDGRLSLTHAQLDAAVQRLAQRLRRVGVLAGDRIGICLTRTTLLPVALLAVMRTGAAYVPLDPDYPAARLAQIAEDAGLRLMLVEAGGPQGPADAGVGLFRLDPEDLLQAARLGSHEAPDQAPVAGVHPDALAYVIYTSGSTGRPKGVAIAHRSAVALLDWAEAEFGATAFERTLASTSICFDLSVFELFAPLACGGSVHLVPNLPEWPRQPGIDGITLVNTVPSLLQQLLEGSGLPLSVRHVALAGEPLPPPLVNRLRQLPQLQSIHNLYGPSEDTTYSTEARFDGSASPGFDGHTVRRVPIGRALPGTQAHVLDIYGEPVPEGVAGELCLGGVGLAHGYLGRPGLSAAAFVPNPLRADASGSDRLYRTGDRVRRDRNGQLHYLGRMDHQVKIRGLRIEVGEIEHALRDHPDVQDAVVMAMALSTDANTQPSPADLTLVVHVEANGIDADALRDFLADRLPRHMVPQRLQVLTALPRLPNGKIDRAALKALAPTARQTTWTAPRTPTEATLALTWSEALGQRGLLPAEARERGLSVHDSFFELGGHSLLAIDLVARMETSLGRPVPLRALFRHPTIEALARHLDETVAGADTAADHVVTPSLAQATWAPIIPDTTARFEPFPLTDIQQAYLMGRQSAFELGEVSTHGYREIDARLDPQAVEAALQQLVQRHDMLRAIVTPDGQQRVLPEVPVPQVAVQDLRSLGDTARHAALQTVRGRLSHQRFDPQQWPLFQVEASRLPDGRTRFHLSFDVLIGDAFSFQLLGREMAMLLQGATLPPLGLAFRDCVLAEHADQVGPAWQAAREHWLQRLDTLPPAPELPLLRQAGREASRHFVRRSTHLAPADWQRLQRHAAACGLTPSAAVLAAFAHALSACSRRADFTLNLTLFNRPPRHPEIDRVVGDFTSSLLLAVCPREGEGIAGLGQRLQDRLWDDMAHRAFSGVRVQRELARRQQRAGGALMPVVFTSTLGQSATRSAPPDWEAEVHWSVSQTSQVVLDHQVSEVDGGLQVNCDALDALFPTGLLDDLHDRHARLLKALADDPEAWQRWEPIPRERQHLAALDSPASDFIGDWLAKTVPPTHANALAHPRLEQLFLSTAHRHPDAPAVLSSGRTLHYGELALAARRIAVHLREQGVRRGDHVAITCAKGWAQVPAALGILIAGAAYVPIDPAWPEARQHTVLRDAHIRCVLGDTHGHRPDGCLFMAIDEGLLAPPATDENVRLDAMLATIDAERCDDHDLAYLIYTSGSTGTPKGVMIDHRGAVNTVLDVNQRHGLQPSDRVFGVSSLSFDLSVWDLFGPLACGAALCLPDADEVRQPAGWAALIARHGVTVWNSVPALLQLLLDSTPIPDDLQPDTLASLRVALLSGDWIPLGLPTRAWVRLPALRVVSMGGATEASIWSIDHPVTHVDPAWQAIPYGRAMTHQHWHVLDAQLRPCPPGVPGELFISGIGVAQGYWGRAALSAERFVPNPFVRPGDAQDTVLYRTGDLGLIDPQDGWIVFLGRQDQQVKVHGHRIELGEIEATLQRHPLLSASAAAVHAADGTPPVLCAYVVPAQQAIQAQGAERLALIETRQRPAGWPDDSAQPPATASVVDLAPVTSAPAPWTRQSHRRFLTAPLPLAHLADLLAALRAQPASDTPLMRHAYPSAGHVYPIQTWLHVREGRVDGLAGGWWRYHPGEHRLLPAGPLPPAHELARQQALLYADNQDLAAGSAFSIFLVARVPALASRYGDRARDFALLEAGHAAQLLMSTAPASNLGLCPLGGIRPQALRQLLQLPEGDEPLYALMGGPINTADTTEQAWPSRPAATCAQPAFPDSGATPLEATLRHWLADHLPAYMVPSRIMVLPSLPLSANGKVDRQALPAPEARQAEHAPAQTPTQALVVQAWAEVIGLVQVGIHDHFFAVGGHSLAALQLLTRLQQATGLNLSLADLLGALTPAEQAAVIDTKRLQQTAPLPATNTPIADKPVDVDTLSDDEVDRLLAELAHNPDTPT